MPKDPNKPIALTRWIHGDVRVHFRSGHIAEVPLSLHGAHSLRKQIEGRQGADSIGGLRAHSGWVWARDDEVVLAEWVPSADYGWEGISVGDRQQLESMGLRHGVLKALADIWGRRGHHEAAYSMNAVAALMTIATKEPRMTRELWERMAVRLEGEEGAGLADPEAVPIRATDSAEPEPEVASGPDWINQRGDAPVEGEAGPQGPSASQRASQRDSEKIGE